MNFILQNILAALLPAAVDGVKQVISRYSGGTVQATNVDEQIKLDNSNVERLKAIAQLDNPYGTPSQWVIDLRASFRYIAAGVVILCGLGLAFIGGDSIPAAAKIAGLDFAGMAFSFIFGDRVLINARK